MGSIPAKVNTRLVEGLKRFKPIVAKAKDKDVNESDTVTIITDMLSEVFGYDKYTEITSEYAIKKTFCDLAIELDGTLKILIEAKAAGLKLKEQHIKQAIDYGANSGIDWVILTNSVNWMVYKIVFGKPVYAELVYEFDFSELNPKKENDIELLYYLTKEAMAKTGKTSSLDQLRLHKQVMNKFVVSQILMTDVVADSVRKILKKISPDAKTTNEEIIKMISEDIIKRDVLDDEKMTSAKRTVTKAINAAKKPKEPKE